MQGEPKQQSKKQGGTWVCNEALYEWWKRKITEEGDFYEFFSEAADLKANFLIRIVQNRMVDDGKKIFHELRSSPVAGSMVVRMSRNPREHIPSRNIKMDYHCKKVTIYRPQRRKEKHLREESEIIFAHI